MKSEMPSNYSPIEKIRVSSEVREGIVNEISDLKSAANTHEDFDVLVNFMDAVADFKDELLKEYAQAEIHQVPLYHHLIGSGIPQQASFESSIPPETMLAIEQRIIEFVDTKLTKVVHQVETAN